MVASNLVESASAGSSAKQQAKKSGSKVEGMMNANQSPEWLPKDWKVEVKIAKAGSPNERKYWSYLSPAGHKFYSKPEVLRHLNVNDDRSSSKQKNSSTGENSKEHVIAQVSEHPEWLPKGWTVQLKTCKGVRIGRTFKCYVDPSAAVKLYSKPEVLRYLESAKENSSAMKQKELGTGVESLSKIDHSGEASVEKVEPEELPPGWVSKLKAKGKRRDWFHTDPVTGITFRSRKDVFRYLETGEISRHAIRPKNSSKNDSEIISNPPPSAAKMQELSDRAIKRKLFSGNGNSTANCSSVPNAEGNSTARVTRASSKTPDIVASKGGGKGSCELSSLAPPITEETSIKRATRGSAKSGIVSTPAIQSPQRKPPLKIASFEPRNLISPKTEGDTSTRRVTRGYSKQVSPSTNHPVVASSKEHPGMSDLDLPNPNGGTSSKRVTRGSAKTMVIDKSVEANDISYPIESAVPEPRELKRKRADIVNTKSKHVAKKNSSPANGSNTKQAKKGSAQKGVEDIIGNTRRETKKIANQKQINLSHRSSRRLAAVASKTIVNLSNGEPTETPIVASTENNEDILALNMIVDSVAQWASQQLSAIPELAHKSSIVSVNQANEELSNRSNNMLLENQSEPKFVAYLDAEKKRDDPENLLGTLPDDQTIDHNENVEILESDKVSNLNVEPDPSFVFGDSWADPCLEFAYKTLTGALPIDDNPEIPNYFQPQSDNTPMHIDNGLGVPKLRIASTFETDDPSQCDAPVTPVYGQRSRSFMSIDVNLPLGPQEFGVDDSNKNHK